MNAAAEIALRGDPSLLFRWTIGTPDPWQATYLRKRLLPTRKRREAILGSRQSGRTTLSGIDAALEAVLSPGSLVVILSPSERQSEIGLAVVKKALVVLGTVLTDESSVRVRLENGSVVHALPGATEQTIRGFPGVRLVICDEAARIEDETFFAATPMLAASGGRLLAISSAWAKQGFFYNAITGGDPAWDVSIVTADDIPRLKADPEFLASERRSMGEDRFLREYYGKWWSDRATFMFDPEDVEACVEVEA